jgi:hypothetical protein
VPELRGGLDHDGVQQLLALVASDSPAGHVRVVLAYHRRHGRPFSEAWASALRSIPRKDPSVADWRVALRWSREHYRVAYETADDEALAAA